MNTILMKDFIGRMNLHHYTVMNKDLLLYDSHRMLLSILFSMRKLYLGQIPNLIFFDYHDDCAPIKDFECCEMLKELRHRLHSQSSINTSEIWNFTEWKLSIDNANWLTASMDMNLINDAVVIGVVEKDRVNRLNDRYKTAERKHYLYTMKHLDQAILEWDTMAADSEQTPREMSSIDYDTYEALTSQSYILDFDLDAFTTEHQGMQIAWSRKDFLSRYVKNTIVFERMQELIQGASLITICREPECCGGLGESNKILSYLDEYFFNGSLKTLPYEDI